MATIHVTPDVAASPAVPPNVLRDVSETFAPTDLVAHALRVHEEARDAHERAALFFDGLAASGTERRGYYLARAARHRLLAEQEREAAARQRSRRPLS
ncbi:hypothetical protein [Cellulomonas fimi]|uniref:Uncharacterized protein n=1 Tax=Cellulomonas fimi (strain ATCC 484 / DSM 20113 / JCM 1341 / CCUG 24087 / LMG 16345 / NBRC 15513 / NCIMB 8980 / NCTC 7547 / NRS-133) TaxID=590998 RepID=F4H281_CELFA|nr:hypothetical protein [Cellulomonas fimi]AEE46378.1 hypothetical protein Celf_2250 [Cellulomonas fimi ATCC 484]NNH07178.1 hypothetical protein [Cellulomonas fimi]VEH32753.1 Uncharacterised protein [Cellulomonas fimi]